MLHKTDDWAGFYKNLHQKTGLDLNLYKQDQMQRRILSMADQKNCRTLAEFWQFIGQGPENVNWFLDRMAINVSELFRNPEKWVELKEQVLPALLKQNKTLKIWSAGCSFGAEAHTLAVMLDHYFPGNHTILGTDIDETALSQAKRGEFNAADMRGVPSDLKSKYFEEYEPNKWRAKSSLKKYLKFQKGNLLADRFDTGYDLIMCRNVVIYFTEEAKEDLYKKFLNALKPGGSLFVGSTERIFNAKKIGFEATLPFFYQKSVEDIKWRNAS